MMQAPPKIQNLPRDVLDLIFGKLDTKTLLRGRNVCRLWKDAISTKDKLWQDLEGFTFSKFVESRQLVHRVGTKSYAKHSHKNNTLLGTINTESINNCIITYNRTILRSYNTTTGQTIEVELVVPSSTSPNLQLIKQLKLSPLDENSTFKHVPGFLALGISQFVLFDENLLSVWQLEPFRCVFSQPNLRYTQNDPICNTNYGLAYITAFNDLEIWDLKKSQRIFEYNLSNKIISFMHSFKNWLVVIEILTKNLIVLRCFDLYKKACVREFETEHAVYYKICDDLFLLRYSDNSIKSFNMSTGVVAQLANKGRLGCHEVNVVYRDKPEWIEVVNPVKDEIIHRFPNMGRFTSCRRGLTDGSFFIIWAQSKHYSLQEWNPRHNRFNIHILNDFDVYKTISRFFTYSSLLFIACRHGDNEILYIYDARKCTLINKMTMYHKSIILNGSLFSLHDDNSFVEHRFTESKKRYFKKSL